MSAPDRLSESPLPSSPTRGEVPLSAFDEILPKTPAGTLALVGSVGEGGGLS